MNITSYKNKNIVIKVTAEYCQGVPQMWIEYRLDRGTEPIKIRHRYGH